MGVPIPLQYGMVAAIPVAGAWLITHAGGVFDRTVAVGRRIGILPTPPPVTFDRPLERLASDLRRLSTDVREVAPGTSHVRRKGLLLAYDDTLIAACRALDVPHSLAALRLGTDRDLERLRVESALEQAGLRFRPVAS